MMFKSKFVVGNDRDTVSLAAKWKVDWTYGVLLSDRARSVWIRFQDGDRVKDW